MPIEVHTSGTELTPIYDPFRHFAVQKSKKCFKFQVKSTSNANLRLLSRYPFDICIGDEFNLKSSIIRLPLDEANNKVSASTPNILNSEKFIGFWILWRNRTITIGFDNNATPFLTFNNIPYLDVQYICIGSSHGASAIWLIDDAHMIKGDCDYNPNNNRSIWIPATNGNVPVGAVSGGYDREELYIARAYCNSVMMPGKLHPSHGVCYVPFDGLEYAFEEYEVLCSCPGEWVYTENEEDFYPNAIISLDWKSLKKFYIGRVLISGVVLVGKIDPHERLCCVPYDGRELTFDQFEIFVAKSHQHSDNEDDGGGFRAGGGNNSAGTSAGAGSSTGTVSSAEAGGGSVFGGGGSSAFGGAGGSSYGAAGGSTGGFAAADETTAGFPGSSSSGSPTGQDAGFGNGYGADDNVPGSDTDSGSDSVFGDV